MNSVLSTLRVFEEVAVRQPIGVSELARVTGIPKSSVQRCLVTLEQARWLRIVDREHARWGVTMKALVLGLRSAGEQDLREVAKPVIQGLAAETGETVLLGLRDGDEYLIVAREDSSQLIRVFMEIGTRVPLGASSGGVSIIARLEPDEIDELVRSEPAEFEGTPMLAPDEMREEIARSAERGYAMNMSSWYRPHVVSLGAAITNSTGRPIAAVTLSIPEMRYESSKEKDLAKLVMTAADEISRLVSSP
ncbi:IclR family transcriptional regulator [Amycolatopsis sp. NPDC098790]|uniref:IclR family transcriptional regulator n=1 Tax=Amycolatopsis sp. NPDC098790 TaxID=3363939 RepID=UPI003824F065